jgi:hypothetical protein
VVREPDAVLKTDAGCSLVWELVASLEGASLEERLQCVAELVEPVWVVVRAAGFDGVRAACDADPPRGSVEGSAGRVVVRLPLADPDLFQAAFESSPLRLRGVNEFGCSVALSAAALIGEGALAGVDADVRPVGAAADLSADT